MTHPKKCSRCGSETPSNAPEGICPRCLVEINWETGTGAASGTGAGPGRPAALAVEEVARLFPEMEILELIGAGGMGAVYKARQPKLNRFVALKILNRHEGDPRFVERFTREAQTLALLNHPNIVAVHDFGQRSREEEKEGGDLFFLIMELVDGVTLRDLLSEGQPGIAELHSASGKPSATRRSRIEPEQALAIVPPICDALQYAHEKGVVHRDIKPENILLDKEGRVKVADFGIARLAGLERAENLTGEGQVIGTAHYMAPEQVERPASVDHRADIYALGVVFYEMLTGELPLGRFPHPSNKVQIDVRLDEVVLKALEKEPEQRYQQASEMRTGVETVAGGEASNPFSSASVAAIRRETGARRPRFSRVAIAGAAWASFFPLAVLLLVTTTTYGLSLTVGGGAKAPELVWWRLLLMVTIVPVGLSAPFGATICGWIAVAQIRAFPGRLYGLGLAVFDGLWFPLLVLWVGVIGLGNVVAHLIVPPRGAGQAWFTVGMITALAFGCVVPSMLIVRWVWRSVNHPSGGNVPGNVSLKSLEKEPGPRYQQASEVKTRRETISSTAGSGAQVQSVAPADGWAESSGRRALLWYGFGVSLIGLPVGIAMGLSLVWGLSLMGIVVGAWKLGLIGGNKVAEEKGAEAPRGGEPAAPPEPRFSRKAIVGAVWAGFFLFFLLGFVGLKSGAPGGHPPVWSKLLLLPLFFAGAAAPLGTTILGWMAVGQIRRSAGRIYGLPLAFIDGILFPVLAVAGLFGWFWWWLFHEVIRGAMLSAYEPPYTALAQILIQHSKGLAVVFTVVSALLIVVPLVWILWRKVRDDGNGLEELPRSGGSRRRLAWVAGGLLILFVIVPAGAVVVYFSVGLGREVVPPGVVVRVEEKLQSEIERRLNAAGWRLDSLSVKVTPDLKRAECVFGAAWRNGLSSTPFVASITIQRQGRDLWLVHGGGEFSFLRFSVDTTSKMASLSHGRPQHAHYGTNDHSAYVVHDGARPHYILYYAGDFNSSTSATSNGVSVVWQDVVTIELKSNGRSFGLLRQSDSSERLILNGKRYDLREGHVFVLQEDGGVRQLALPVEMVSHDNLVAFGERVAKALAETAGLAAPSADLAVILTEFPHGVWNRPLAHYAQNRRPGGWIAFMNFPPAEDSWINADDLNLPANVSGEEIAVKANAGALYVPDLDHLAPVRGTKLAPLKVKPLPPGREPSDHGTWSLVLPHKTRQEIAEVIETYDQAHPTGHRGGKWVRMENGGRYAALRPDGELMLITAFGSPGSISVQLIPIGNVSDETPPGARAEDVDDRPEIEMDGAAGELNPLPRRALAMLLTKSKKAYAQFDDSSNPEAIRQLATEQSVVEREMRSLLKGTIAEPLLEQMDEQKLAFQQAHQTGDTEAMERAKKEMKLIGEGLETMFEDAGAFDGNRARVEDDGREAVVPNGERSAEDGSEQSIPAANDRDEAEGHKSGFDQELGQHALDLATGPDRLGGAAQYRRVIEIESVLLEAPDTIWNSLTPASYDKKKLEQDAFVVVFRGPRLTVAEGEEVTLEFSEEESFAIGPVLDGDGIRYSIRGHFAKVDGVWISPDEPTDDTGRVAWGSPMIYGLPAEKGRARVLVLKLRPIIEVDADASSRLGPPAVFGPVTERTLRSDADTIALLNIKTGEVSPMAVHQDGGEPIGDFDEHMEEAGTFQLGVFPRDDDWDLITGFDLAELPRNAWDTVSEAEMALALEVNLLSEWRFLYSEPSERKPPPRYAVFGKDDFPPINFAFRTRDHVTGILQIVGFTEQGAPPHEMRVRYKVLDAGNSR